MASTKRTKPSQDTTIDSPVPYTGSPPRQLLSDTFLFLRNLRYLLNITLPLTPWRSGRLDELFPSPKNIFDLIVHSLLFVLQTVFLLSLPLGMILMTPALWMVAYVVGFCLANHVICRIALNGPRMVYHSRVPLIKSAEHQKEHWIWINGVAAGQHWLQSGLDRLAYTFGRQITGVHNPTEGIIFDIIQCLVQRCFNYETRDVREAYALVKKALLGSKYNKVILILHSQGGIEGGLIIDWLLDQLPSSTLRNLEVYTFGNAANHFNNLPRKHSQSETNTSAGLEQDESVPYIEHYANSDDFVSIWGVLQFAKTPNRYMGKLFVRPGSGHQFVQHYLDNMFPLGLDRKVLESNEFMDTVVDGNGHSTEDWEGNPCIHDTSIGFSGVDDSFKENEQEKDHCQRPLQLRDLSRLWQYRNGASPDSKVP